MEDPTITLPLDPDYYVDTQLYLVDDGETHWVSARSPERAMEIFKASIGEELDEWKDSPPTVCDCPLQMAARLKFTFEDGEKCKLSNAFEILRGHEGLLASTLI